MIPLQPTLTSNSGFELEDASPEKKFENFWHQFQRFLAPRPIDDDVGESKLNIQNRVEGKESSSFLLVGQPLARECRSRSPVRDPSVCGRGPLDLTNPAELLGAQPTSPRCAHGPALCNGIWSDRERKRVRNQTARCPRGAPDDLSGI